MHIQEFLEVQLRAFRDGFLLQPGCLLSEVSDRLVDPIDLEPMIWSVRVAVKPVLGSCHRATSCCLVNEALRHQRNLIAEYPRQSDTLDQVLAAFVLTTEDVKVVRDILSGDLHQIIGPMIRNLVPSALEH